MGVGKVLSTVVGVTGKVVFFSIGLLCDAAIGMGESKSKDKRFSEERRDEMRKTTEELKNATKQFEKK